MIAKYKIIFFLVFLMILFSSCYIYTYNNGIVTGTPWPKRNEFKVSDFYHDLDNIIFYDGKYQEYRVKVKSFFWQDENNANHTIESAFFIVKGCDTSGNFHYAFQYRRYIIFANEESKSNKIRELWADGTEIQRGATLYLSDSMDKRFTFGMPHRSGWACIDGLYERYNFSMRFEKQYGPILNQIIFDSKEFKFNFPSENLETNGFDLESKELDYIRKNGVLPELENNSFSLTTEELDKLKKEVIVLIEQKSKKPKKYIEQMKDEILK
jgi:hypothetical protein